MTTRRSTLLDLGAVLAIAAIPSTAVFAQDKAPALDGHDPVAYFTEKRPMLGISTISHEFDERRYLFANNKHRDLFAASPERYEPQFNGLCAIGVSKGKKGKANPNVWRVIDGKLFVFSRELPDEDAYAEVALAALAKSKDLK